MSYLVRSLVVIAEKTRFQPEVSAMIETCKPWVRQLREFDEGGDTDE